MFLLQWYLVCIFLNTFFFRIQEQLRRIKRNQEKEKLQPVKKKKEKPPNNVTVLSCFKSLSFFGEKSMLHVTLALKINYKLQSVKLRQKCRQLEQTIVNL